VSITIIIITIMIIIKTLYILLPRLPADWRDRLARKWPCVHTLTTTDINTNSKLEMLNL